MHAAQNRSTMTIFEDAFSALCKRRPDGGLLSGLFVFRARPIAERRPMRHGRRPLLRDSKMRLTAVTALAGLLASTTAQSDTMTNCAGACDVLPENWIVFG
jgi:hypothetical protein